ncbi:MAG: hypothetical protein GY807_24020 [Gammaproteobacteria bacterium]|nr:hypothetical protein [Gammaproteobacteria bacterium]
MANVREITKAIGRDRLQDAVGVGYKMINRVEVNNQFPPSWFPTVRRLGIEAGIEVPERLFSWRKPEDASEAAQ